MFRFWKRAGILAAEPVRAPQDEPTSFDSLPFIDNESLDRFLADPDNIDRLPVDPSDYRPAIQRMIVNAFLHEAAERAKEVETV